MADSYSTVRVERGIRRKKRSYEAYVTHDGKAIFKCFPEDTPLEVIRLWRATARSAKPSASFYFPEVTVPPRAVSGGYVYFMQMNGYIKIGKTRDIAQRLDELQTAHPEPLRLVAWIHHEFPSRIECTIMREYADDRVRGEWFKLTSHMVRLIKKHAEALTIVEPAVFEKPVSLF